MGNEKTHATDRFTAGSRRATMDELHDAAHDINRPVWRQAIRDRLDARRETARMESEARVDYDDEAFQHRCEFADLEVH